ncbi:MAG: MBL fold metallo-hydrolase [Bacteroidota bacterium]|nr:MBL fold metallo-hydrolase [Bacteroidota bacterium]
MKISKFVFNLFQVNTFVLYDETKEAIIIDPGCGSDTEKKQLLDFIEKNELKPKAIVNTHCHIDHIIGVDFLKEHYNIEFWANRDDQYLLDIIVEVANMYGVDLDKAPVIDKHISALNEISFGKSKLALIEVPGHTDGHLAFFSPKDQFVLTGDVLFKDTIGRTDLPGGDLDRLMNSILTQILPLGDEVDVLSGHGPDTTIGAERKNNPFL